MPFKRLVAVSFLPMLVTVPAQAEVPGAVQLLIDKAIESRKDEDVETVISVAKQAYPADAAQLDAMLDDYNQVRTAEKSAEKQANYANAGFFDNWTGKGELGAFRSTGNSSNLGIAASLTLEKDARKWRHKIRARADYQRNNGNVSREQFLFSYEPNYKLNDRLFAYGLAQYERDRFQGFSARYSVSGGLGYSIIQQDDIHLDLKAGPAWRKTDFVGGGSDSSLAGLAGLDLGWQFAEDIALTEVANAYLEGGNSTYSSTTALTAKINDSLSSRFSYTVEYETDPPPGRASTDTISRATLVYGF